MRTPQRAYCYMCGANRPLADNPASFASLKAVQSSSSARGDAMYDVVVLGLDRSSSEVAAGLERVFGLDAATAHSVISALPATVCHGVNEIRAQYFMRALCGIGARVELRAELLAEQEQPERHVSQGQGLAPANDVGTVPAQPSAANVSPSVRAATLLMGSDPLAATLTALPAPQLPAAEPEELEPPTLQHESTLPKAPLIIDVKAAASYAGDAGPRWGELVREPLKPRPVSRPMAVQADRPSGQDPASYGQLSLPAPEGGLPLVSLSPLGQPVPGRERIGPAPARGAPPPPAATRTVAIPKQRAEVVERKRAVIAAAATKQPVRTASLGDRAEFWSELPSLLTFPWRERGWYWFVSIGIWAISASVLSALAKMVPTAGTAFVFMLSSSVLALCADYHRRCMWAVANAEGTLADGPDFHPVRILNTYLRSGMHLLLFALVSQLPLTLWLVNEAMEDGVASGINLVLSRRFWLLAALPGLYWPMAVGTASLYKRFQGVWYVPVGLRAMLRAPLEYACITLIGGATLVLPWLVCSLIVRAAGLPDLFFWGAAGLPLAASHAVMGTLTGQLMRARPELFESAAE